MAGRFPPWSWSLAIDPFTNDSSRRSEGGPLNDRPRGLERFRPAFSLDGGKWPETDLRSTTPGPFTRSCNKTSFTDSHPRGRAGLIKPPIGLSEELAPYRR